MMLIDHIFYTCICNRDCGLIVIINPTRKFPGPGIGATVRTSVEILVGFSTKIQWI